jgi:PAS domain S-box-containing protein
MFRTLNPAGSVIWLEDSGRAFFDGQGTLIRVIGIVADITERKQAQEALHESEERLNLAALAGKMFAYEWDAATDKIVRSEGVPQILGLDAGAHTTGQEILKMVPPEDRARLIAAIAQLRPEEPHLRISYRMVRSDGSVIWVERTSRAYFDEQGRMLRMVGMIADITERKRQEAVLRESEERFRLVADTAPTLIWMSGTDKLCTYFNKPWLDFTGRSMDSELGNGWVEGVHPEDLQRCLETYTKSFDRREKFRMEYRLRGYDGEYRWILDIGVPRFNADGSFAGYIGSCVDVTERKLAEAALANVNGRLIETQEQERTRIGRELHDDIGQRLALLAIQLQLLQEDSLVLPEVRSRMDELKKETSQIANDVQSLSHELHSAKLQYLGLAAAMRGFCREFAEQRKAEVDFTSHDLPSPLSPETSLCLFRVLQEALHNSAKHSGVRHFEVRLWGTSGEIQLTVKDSGAGFDREAAKTSRGLGLISMEERLKLVDGTLSINSQPKGGTTIHARVPLGSGSDSVRAAG